MSNKIQAIAAPFAVGLVVVLSAAAFVYFVQKTTRSKFGDDGYHVWAIFQDATGLTKRSTVRIAGIPIGMVDRVELVESAAKITLYIRKEIILKEDCILRKMSDSPVLGEYFIEVVPGVRGRTLVEGDQIMNVVVDSDIEMVFNNLQVITRDIQNVTAGLRQLLVDDEGYGSFKHILSQVEKISTHLSSTVENFDESMKMNRTSIEDTIRNINRITENLERISGKGAKDYEAVAGDIKEITSEVKKLVAEINSMVGAGKGDVEKSVASLKDNIEKLDKTLTKLGEITGDVAEGKGTVGRLLKDDTIARNIETTTEDVSVFTRRLSRLSAEIGLRGEMHFGSKKSDRYLWSYAKTSFSLTLKPRWDKFYIVQLTDDKRPKTTRKQEIRTVIDDKGNVTTEEIRTTESSQHFKLSLLYGRRFDFWVMRLGLIENTGGVGTDFYMFDDYLSFSFDAYDFINPNLYPHLRSYLTLSFLNYFQVFGGVDDFINKGYIDGFAGIGIRFTDDDIFGIITFAPSVSSEK